MKKIVLIAPGWYFKRWWIPEDQGFSQNLGLGYLAAVLIKAGHKVKIIDAFAQGENEWIKIKKYNIYRCGLSYDAILKQIDEDTDYVGITGPFTNLLSEVNLLAEKIKQRFKYVKIIKGGILSSTLPEQTLDEYTDFIVLGEGEESLLKIINSEKKENIKGIGYWEDGKKRINKEYEYIQNLDKIPFPARDIMPMEKYVRLSPRGTKYKRTISIITSRGCPYDCEFCSVHPIYGWKYRFRTPDNVIEEIKECMEKYKMNFIEFEDDNISLIKDRFKSILEGIIKIKEKQEIQWSAPNGIKVETLDEQTIKLIKKSGCDLLMLAVESGDEKILKAMNKKNNLEKIKKIVELCGKYDINTMAFLIVGYPEEDAISFEKTKQYYNDLLKLGLKSICPLIIKPYPDTKLYYRSIKENLLINNNSLFFLEDKVYLKSKNFTPDEVLKRKRYFIKKLYPISYYLFKGDMNSVIRKFIKSLIKKDFTFFRNYIKCIKKQY